MNVVFQSSAVLLFLCLLQTAPLGDSAHARNSGAREKRGIVGGKKAEKNQFPFAVCIKEFVPMMYIYEVSCAGSLITTQSVLTAGHCAYTHDNKILDVFNLIGVVGSVKNKRGKLITFQEFRVHPNISLGLLFTDIAIFILDKPVTLGDSIRTIPLAGRSLIEVGESAMVLGWGKTGRKPFANTLRYATMRTVSLGICVDNYAYLKGDEICFEKGGQGGCDGDSGAPVIVQHGNQMVLLGPFSYSEDPCGKGGPSVAMNVTPHRAWIASNAVGTVQFV